MSTSDDGEILEAFLEESRENLAQLDVDLVALEAHPDDPELLGRVFRTVHTIKGTCGFLGFPNLEALTHAGESLLGTLRTGDLALDAAVTTSLLRLVDAIRAVLGHIETTQREGDDEHRDLIGELTAHLEHTDVTPVVATVLEPERDTDLAAGLAASTESSVRIDVAVLDKLMDLVGELVLARSRLADLELGDDDLTEPHRHLRSVTNELQAAVMQARLQPVGIVIGRLHRIVRDLATALGKHVRLEIEGEDVGVDKAVNEALRDPLLHIVRNAVDHGLELPAERASLGKPDEGLLHIRAYHESGMVHIEVRDDGRGIDPDRLLASAIDAGLLTRERGDELGQREIFELMFRPGLSTKTEVTNVSGRGVGMDVVRANLQQIGGSIEIQSEPGAGTTFRLNVPLTLAIMPVLMVECAGQQYAVPGVNVREVLHHGRVDDVDGARLYRLRGHLLPLAELTQLLGGERSSSVVVVVEIEGRRFGVVVDAAGDTADVVVKPLTSATRDIPLFSAVTILGDGRPSLILDLPGLAEASGIEPSEEDEAVEQESGLTDVDDLLVALARDGGRLALRLRDVLRVEQLSATLVENAGPVEMVQYRDALVPLLRVDELLPERRGRPRSIAEDPEDGLLRTIMCDSSVGAVALVVGGVDDIAPEPAVPAQPASRAGVEACLVVGGLVVELLDLEALVSAAGLRSRG